MSHQDLIAELCDRRACHLAVDWVHGYMGDDIWRDCRRADWMLWAYTREAMHTDLVRCACLIARSVLHLIPTAERRPLAAIETAEIWRGAESLDAAKCASDAATACDNAGDDAHARATKAYEIYAAAKTWCYVLPQATLDYTTSHIAHATAEACRAASHAARTTTNAICAACIAVKCVCAASCAYAHAICAADVDSVDFNFGIEYMGKQAACADIVRSVWPAPPRWINDALGGKKSNDEVSATSNPKNLHTY